MYLDILYFIWRSVWFVIKGSSLECNHHLLILYCLGEKICSVCTIIVYIHVLSEPKTERNEKSFSHSDLLRPKRLNSSVTYLSGTHVELNGILLFHFDCAAQLLHFMRVKKLADLFIYLRDAYSCQTGENCVC